jgi:hypothetical protein
MQYSIFKQHPQYLVRKLDLISGSSVAAENLIELTTGSTLNIIASTISTTVMTLGNLINSVASTIDISASSTLLNNQGNIFNLSSVSTISIANSAITCKISSLNL